MSLVGFNVGCLRVVMILVKGYINKSSLNRSFTVLSTII